MRYLKTGSSHLQLMQNKGNNKYLKNRNQKNWLSLNNKQKPTRDNFSKEKYKIFNLCKKNNHKLFWFITKDKKNEDLKEVGEIMNKWINEFKWQGNNFQLFIKKKNPERKSWNKLPCDVMSCLNRIWMGFYSKSQ